ncbi:MAG: hypothetical protein ACM3UZ_13685 [Acidobacteriota bacterium]
MKVLLATGMVAEENAVQKYLIDSWRCYDLETLLEIADQPQSVIQFEAAVISPLIGNSSELIKVIKNLIGRGIRVVFLPGDEKHPEARGWVDRLVPMGVRDYVYNKVTPEKIFDKVMNPAVNTDLVKQPLIRSLLNRSKTQTEESKTTDAVQEQASSPGVVELGQIHPPVASVPGYLRVRPLEKTEPDGFAFEVDHGLGLELVKELKRQGTLVSIPIVGQTTDQPIKLLDTKAPQAEDYLTEDFFEEWLGGKRGKALRFFLTTTETSKLKDPEKGPVCQGNDYVVVSVNSRETPVSRITNNDLTGMGRHVILVSPWQQNAGVTEISLSLSRALKLALVDANTDRPGVSRAMEIPENQRWQYDWRTYGEKAVVWENERPLIMLDPSLDTPPPVGMIDRMRAIGEGTGRVIWDFGGDPGNPYIQELLRHNATILIIIDVSQQVGDLQELMKSLIGCNWSLVLNKVISDREIQEAERITGARAVVSFPLLRRTSDYDAWSDAEKSLCKMITG